MRKILMRESISVKGSSKKAELYLEETPKDKFPFTVGVAGLGSVGAVTRQEAESKFKDRKSKLMNYRGFMR